MSNKESWKTDSKHTTFESADTKRKTLLKESENLSVKVRRRPDNTYTVKTRMSAASEPSAKKSEVKKPKNRAARRNEKNKRNKN